MISKFLTNIALKFTADDAMREIIKLSDGDKELIVNTAYKLQPLISKYQPSLGKVIEESKDITDLILGVKNDPAVRDLIDRVKAAGNTASADSALPKLINDDNEVSQCPSCEHIYLL